MFKKLLVAASLFCGMGLSSQAQNFTITTNPVDSTTTGSAIFIGIGTFVQNLSTTDSMVLNWQVVENTIPSGWTNQGVCDNNQCFTDPNVLNGSTVKTNIKVGPSQKASFAADILAPPSAPNGTGIVRVAVSTPQKTDTLILRLNKISAPTSVTTVKASDKRVSIAPNPATNSMVVFSDKSLNAAKIAIVNLAGQVVYTTSVSKSTENTTINTSAFATGTYIVNISDNKGQIVTARKFVKD